MAFVFVCIAITMIFRPHIIIRPFESYFALYDESRGLHSGATHRIDLWRDTWKLFLANPIIGTGFRAHESTLQVGVSSHNGYLATLAETGILGASCLVYLLLRGLVFMWGKARTRGFEYGNPFSILVGLSAGYLVVGFFERYLINIGNPTSMLFLMAVFSYAREVVDTPDVTNSRTGHSSAVMPDAQRQRWIEHSERWRDHPAG